MRNKDATQTDEWTVVPFAEKRRRVKEEGEEGGDKKTSLVTCTKTNNSNNCYP